MSNRFAIVCMGRTGSTLLVDLLDSHPEIECRGELFGLESGYSEYPGTTRREFLERHAYKTDLPIKGFKMPIDWIFNYPGIFDDFKELGYKIIRLNRRNALAHLVSMKLAGINTNWGSKHQYRVQKTTVSLLELYIFIGSRHSFNVTMDRFSAPLATTTIDYEDLMEHTHQERLLLFLGARPCALTTSSTVKQRTVALSESIENFTELSEALSNTPYASLVRTASTAR